MKMVWMGLMMVSMNAFAYNDGEYLCRNANPEFPKNSYTLSTSEVGGVSLPVLSVKRYVAGVNGAVDEITIKGIAEISTRGGREIIALNATRLEFVDGKLQNCRD